ncbi:MAG: GMC oxidoreductase [Chloroflexi bacterium]|nr:GMC oxidoreductase [Chloroflexota bacterium]MDA1146887.1 GMC oxidoreductase [Chloroflexota bacterium]
MLLSHGLQNRPFDAVDFEARSAVAESGWPIDAATLAPYYERAQVACGLSLASYEAASWLAHEQTVGVPLDEGILETVVFRYAPAGHFSGLADHFRGLEQVEVLTGSSVVNLHQGPGDALESVQVRTLDGNSFSVRATTFVLAAGAIENARLMLASKDRDPRGVGNEHDLVGRYFMEHPQVTVGRWYAREDALEAMPFYDWHRREPDGETLRGHLRIDDDGLREHDLMNAVFELFPMRPTATSPGWRALNRFRRAIQHKNRVHGTVRSVAEMARHAPDLVANMRARRGGVPRNVVMVDAMAEQEPNPESRVQLGSRLDRLGMPRTRLDWRLTHRDFDSLRRSAAVLGADFERQGLGTFESLLDDRDDRIPVFGNWHHMGTTRMHDDPRSGVVDADCRVHGLSNLYVGGSSVFTTGGSSNPTLTLVALALRLADHLRPR